MMSLPSRFKNLTHGGRSILLFAAISLTAAMPAAAADVVNATFSLLNESQYRQIIKDVFGPTVSVNGRFQPEVRDETLLSIGARKASITASTYEQYDAIARDVAAQVVNEERRLLLPCKPADQQVFDEACARKFVSRNGRLLLRRPLPEGELAQLTDTVKEVTSTLGSFDKGLEMSLTEMLTSADFLFIHQNFEEDPGRPGQLRLDAYSKASRLSFFLWNTSPNATLLGLAESGRIHDPAVVRRQVALMLASPRIEDGVRAFFTDMLGFDDVQILTKDIARYPRFTLAAKRDATEQTLRTIVQALIVDDGDYRDLFTTRKTFLTASLAALYGVPFVDTSENGVPSPWLPFEYPAGDPRAGILAHVSFSALHSHSATTSPTLRGKAVREYFLCQKVPAPPANVDFSQFNNPDTQFKTLRAKLLAHSSQPMCAGCHKITDPLGLSLENFDTAGSFRATENGQPIDASGELNGVRFTNILGVSDALRNDPALTSCVARKVYAFGTGQMPNARSPEWKAIEAAFAQSGYKFRALLASIADSELFISGGAAITTPLTQR